MKLLTKISQTENLPGLHFINIFYAFSEDFLLFFEFSLDPNTVS